MLIDLHNHTLPQSLCSTLKPEELIKRAKKAGLDGVCLTEHDRLWPLEPLRELGAKHGLLVLRGVEVTTQYGHVLVFGVEQSPGSLGDIRELRKLLDEVGGAIIAAHPFRENHNLSSLANGQRLFDALEVLNGSEPQSHFQLAQRLCLETGLRGVGGSDTHASHEVASCATEFFDPITSEADLVRAIKSGRFRAVDLRRKSDLRGQFD